MNGPKCFGVAGWKNSGKTSLVAGLVKEFSAREMTVSTIKHAHHSFDLDKTGTDSFNHRDAGAQEVVLVSVNRWAIQHELRGRAEPDFDEILARIAPCDLVLVEGYKREPIPKIEIIGPENTGDFLWQNDRNIQAIACDSNIEDCPLSQFERNQVYEIADFILKFLGKST